MREGGFITLQERGWTWEVEGGHLPEWWRVEAPSQSSPERGGAGCCSGLMCPPAASGSPALRRGSEAAGWEDAVSRASAGDGTTGCLGTHPLVPDCCFCLATTPLSVKKTSLHRGRGPLPPRLPSPGAGRPGIPSPTYCD